VKVISHSPLLYWWPVWACGFIMAALTWIDGSVMATVPDGTTYRQEVISTTNSKGDKVRENRWILDTKRTPGEKDEQPNDPRLHVARNKSLGVIFFTVLLLVVFITNVPLRGMWSILIVVLVVLISLILHLAGWWARIVDTLTLLDVRINMGGYLFVSIALCALWALTVMVFDRRIYIVFTPGQFRVCTEIGGGEKVYDTMGMKLEKQQSDLFRHYVLGLGAGDLTVKTAGATQEHFDLHNVLWINSKVQKIEDMLQKRKVVESSKS
jgi:hypothetical protein